MLRSARRVPRLFDPATDPAPDVYTVRRLPGERVRIGHFRSVIASRECCHAVIEASAIGRPLIMPCGVEV